MVKRQASYLGHSWCVDIGSVTGHYLLATLYDMEKEEQQAVTKVFISIRQQALGKRQGSTVCREDHVYLKVIMSKYP